MQLCSFLDHSGHLHCALCCRIHVQILLVKSPEKYKYFLVVVKYEKVGVAKQMNKMIGVIFWNFIPFLTSSRNGEKGVPDLN